MEIFTLKSDPKVMGEEHEKYGFTFWGYAEESDLPIMFNSKQGNVLAGDTIVAEEQTVKKSSKGTDYIRLSKTKIKSSGSEGTHMPSSNVSTSTQAQQSPAGATDSGKYLKDTSDYHERVLKEFIKLEDYHQVKSSSAYRTKFLAFVDDIAWWLKEKNQDMRSGTKTSQNGSTELTEPSGLEKARAKADSLRKKDVEDVTEEYNPDELNGMFEE